MSAQLKKEKYSEICLSAIPFTLDLVYINKPNVDINENNASSELHATRPFCSVIFYLKSLNVKKHGNYYAFV